MTGHEHYRMAEELLAGFLALATEAADLLAEGKPEPDGVARIGLLLAKAQVHATLSVADMIATVADKMPGGAP
jgi:hypothetical protein